MLTYTQQQQLVEQGLAKASIDEENNLVTFKYAKKVMYDYLWDKHPELLNCRGHVYDVNTKQLVVAAPTKTFNYLENDTWKDHSLSSKVTMYKKFNGFLGSITCHNNKLVVSTTGTTTSEYAQLARKSILKSTPFLDSIHSKMSLTGLTLSYEICDPSDPHIVQEEPGAYLLGYRFNDDRTGGFTPVGEGIVCTLQDALELVKTDEGEGYMVYDDLMRCCKLKTPYYVGKKKIIRMNKHQVNKMYNPEYQQNIVDSLPDRWKFAVDCIQQFYTNEEWLDKTDQQRRVCLENFDNDCTK